MLYDFEAATWHHYICDAVLNTFPKDTNCGVTWFNGFDYPS